MSATEIDYPLLNRCLRSAPNAWEDFVDRFMGLVLHVIDQTMAVRRLTLTSSERVDLCEAVFRALRYNNCELLRDFDQKSLLSTWLVVMTRRLVVAFLLYDDH
ncbi:MAG: hypothetical protein J6S75_10915 [Thermoguttaceae bacterium]|nr:hypothetical protein [Thermoguttaceae bacterium]